MWFYAAEHGFLQNQDMLEIIRGTAAGKKTVRLDGRQEWRTENVVPGQSFMKVSQLVVKGPGYVKISFTVPSSRRYQE